ncbi:hypothetical protein [Methylobacterium sp. Leaf117]|uniref:hypothetical protein n=1 Tax=Methylobacterium sp. Leaf117 TaxID=1736260 RepID=UPI0012E0E3E6|nr:hypothetical protein [Methylobacterium sp. Leaf117]
MLANATSLSIRIDGMSETTVSEKELGRTLAGLKVGTVKVALANASERLAAPVRANYDLAFQIAAPRALQAVERAFLERMTVNGLTVGTVGEFRADARCQGAASDYATGMAEYVLGVLVKERPHGQSITSALDRYRSLFGSALEKLTPHQRPLPQLLCAVMRFALNQFGTGPLDTGYHELDAATVMLRGPVMGPAIPMPADIPGRQAACPMDHGTDWILGLAGRMSRQDRWGPVLRDECRQAAETGTLDIMDRQKALALWALTALRLGAPQEAVEPLAQISAIYPFSIWANACLETVTT